MWTEEDVAKISSGEWQTIDGKITAAIDSLKDSLKPHGWRKTAHLIREIGTPVTFVTAFLAMLAITLSAVYQSVSHVRDEIEFRTQTKDRLTHIESILLGIRTSQLAANPNSEKSQTEAKNIIASARQGSTPIPTMAVEQAGDSFIEAAKTEPKAWDVALNFIAYRSSLNMPPPPLFGEKTSTTRYDIPGIVGKPPPVLQNCCAVDMPMAARIELIGHNLNISSATGPARLFLSGGVIDIDDYYLKQVTLTGVEVHYTGHPLVLENVTFINCVFVMDNTDQTRRLASDLLNSSPVSFRS